MWLQWIHPETNLQPKEQQDLQRYLEWKRNVDRHAEHVRHMWLARESRVYRSGRALSDTYNISHDKEPLNSPIVTVFVLHVG